MKKLSKKQKLIILISFIIVVVIISIVISANAIRVSIANEDYNSSNSDSSNGNLLPEYIKKGMTLGGVTGTLESLDTSDATASAEDIAWGKTAYVDGKKITGTYRTLKDLKIGDFVDYKPDASEPYTGMTEAATGSTETSDNSIAQEDLRWRILSINDDGTVDLISSSPTSQYISFYGAKGYNNSVYLLNDICAKLYSNSSLGAIARNINLEDDIEPKMNSTGIAYRDSYEKGQTYAYGNVVTYDSNRYYPNLYAKEIGSGIDTGVARGDGITKNDSYYSSPTDETSTQAVKSLTVTSDYYFFYVGSSYFDDQTWYDMVFNTSSYYWLGSRCVRASSSNAGFFLRFVSDGGLRNYDLFNSSDDSTNRTASFCPIVSLKSNIRVGSGDGESPDTAYQLIQ